MNAKKQLNARVPERKRKAVFDLCNVLNLTRDEMIELAIDSLFGNRDELSRVKRKRVLEKAKELSISSSFNGPDGQHIGMAA